MNPEPAFTADTLVVVFDYRWVEYAGNGQQRSTPFWKIPCPKVRLSPPLRLLMPTIELHDFGTKKLH